MHGVEGPQQEDQDDEEEEAVRVNDITIGQFVAVEWDAEWYPGNIVLLYF